MARTWLGNCVAGEFKTMSNVGWSLVFAGYNRLDRQKWWQSALGEQYEEGQGEDVPPTYSRGSSVVKKDGCCIAKGVVPVSYKIRRSGEGWEKIQSGLRAGYARRVHVGRIRLAGGDWGRRES
jgi:hypothetical protein